MVQNRGPRLDQNPTSDLTLRQDDVIDCVIISDLIQMSCSCSLDNPLRNMLQTIMSAGPVIFEKSQRSLLLGRSRPSAGPKFGAGRCHGSDPLKQGRTGPAQVSCSFQSDQIRVRDHVRGAGNRWHLRCSLPCGSILVCTGVEHFLAFLLRLVQKQMGVSRSGH